jgi:hypothetical protein
MLIVSIFVLACMALARSPNWKVSIHGRRTLYQQICIHCLYTFTPSCSSSFYISSGLSLEFSLSLLWLLAFISRGRRRSSRQWRGAVEAEVILDSESAQRIKDQSTVPISVFP